jgi:tyrosine decarboxylase / aspartate 1-decarboxylase
MRSCPTSAMLRWPVVPAAEFDLPAGHLDAPPLPAVRFPERGRPEAEVLDDVRGRFDEDRFEPDRNFSITYSGIPSPIAQRVEELARGRFFVEWARETELGTWSMEREAVAMMVSLLGGDERAGGFITTGGTESNLAAMRLARNLGAQAEPEIVAPVTMHFSFRLGAELMGIRLVEIDVDDETYLPRMEDVERAITPRTVGLVCSAPGGSFGVLDPVEAFADLAQRTGLYLHVDAAFGGFILPFMRDLGHAVPPFDLSLPGVSSISTDGHKLGLLPIATGLFLVKDAAALESIPTERTLIHTTSSTKPGSRAAAAWATLRHLGREGYVASTAHVLGLADIIADGVTAIDGMELAAPRFISILGFTSSSIDLEIVHRLLAEDGWGQGYGVTRGKPFIRLSIHPSRDVEHADGFVAAFSDAVARARRT